MEREGKRLLFAAAPLIELIFERPEGSASLNPIPGSTLHLFLFDLRLQSEGLRL